MSTRTADLTGARLDYWAAKAVGEVPMISPFDGRCRVSWKLSTVPGESNPGTIFEPGSSWRQGGPLIDCEIMTLGCSRRGDEVIWAARHKNLAYCLPGPNALIASMRAVVASKYGDSVPGEE